MQLDILVPHFGPPLELPELKPLPFTPQPPAESKPNIDVGVFADTDLRPMSTVSARQRSDGDAFIQRSQDSAFRAQALAAPHSFRWHGRRPFFAGLSSLVLLSFTCLAALFKRFRPQILVFPLPFLDFLSLCRSLSALFHSLCVKRTWLECAGGLEEAAKQAQEVLISEPDYAWTGTRSDLLISPRSSPTLRHVKGRDALGPQRCDSVTEQCGSFRPVGITPLDFLGSYCSGKAAAPPKRLLTPMRKHLRPWTASSGMSSRAGPAGTGPPQQYLLADLAGRWSRCAQEVDAAAEVWSARVMHLDFNRGDAGWKGEGQGDLFEPAPSRHAVLSARTKSLTPRSNSSSTLAAKRSISKTLLALEKHIGAFSLHRIFKEWVRVMRRNRASSVSGMGTSLNEACSLLRARFADIFNNNFVNAFIFLDVNGGGEISGYELRRGLYRLNLHEVWRCPVEGGRCCKYDCWYRPPEPVTRIAPNLHSYLLIDERMCTEILKRADRQGASGGAHGIDLEEFLAMFDPSIFAQKGLKHLDVHAAIADRHSAAMKNRAQIIKTGCDWGTLEDWRRHARAKAFAGKRDVYASLSQLDALKLARTQAFESLKDMQLQGSKYIHENKEERDALLLTLTSSMSSFRKHQDTVYDALKDGCVLMVLQTPLLDYYQLHVPRLEPGATNIETVLESCLGALESLNDEQRKQVLIKDYEPRSVRVRLPLEGRVYSWANEEWATKDLNDHEVPDGVAAENNVAVGNIAAGRVVVEEESIQRQASILIRNIQIQQPQSQEDVTGEQTSQTQQAAQLSPVPGERASFTFARGGQAKAADLSLRSCRSKYICFGGSRHLACERLACLSSCISSRRLSRQARQHVQYQQPHFHRCERNLQRDSCQP